MEFKELLNPDFEANDLAVIKLLQVSGLPVVIYGVSADVADGIVKKLAVNNIKIDAVTYDKDSPVMSDETIFLKNKPKIHVSVIDGIYPAYNVILGFVRVYDKIDRIKEKFKHAQSVNYLSEIFDMEEITYPFIYENREFLENFYNNLADLRSKDSFTAYLMSKTRQDMKYLPPIFDKTQYFPNDIISLTDRESYFDCGAFTGDTVSDFFNATKGKYERIWAAEPDKTNFNKLQSYVIDNQLHDTVTVNKGVYESACLLPFRSEGSMLSMIDDTADNFIEMDSIDNITAGKPVTYIKFDVEGAELSALKGAKQTILKYKPTLGVSIYHKQSDLVAIPEYVKSLIPDYRFFFRVHKKLAIDTILYCIL